MKDKNQFFSETCMTYWFRLQKSVSKKGKMSEGKHKAIKMYLREWPMKKRLIFISPIDHQRPTPPHIINTLIRQLLNPGSHSTTTSNPYGLSSFNFFHCASGYWQSSSTYSSAALIRFAISILTPLFAAIIMREAPFNLSSCTRTSPVGPALRRRSVNSSSVQNLWIL